MYSTRRLAGRNQTLAGDDHSRSANPRKSRSTNPNRSASPGTLNAISTSPQAIRARTAMVSAGVEASASQHQQQSAGKEEALPLPRR
jgi:hypothetical protein